MPLLRFRGSGLGGRVRNAEGGSFLQRLGRGPEEEASAIMAEPEGLILPRSQKEMEAWSTFRASAIASWDHCQFSRMALIRSPRVEVGTSRLGVNPLHADLLIFNFG